MHRKRLIMHRSFVSAFSATVVSLFEIPPSTRGDAPGSYQLDAEGLQEKRALYLDRFDFRTLVLKASFGSVGPVLFLTGFVWVIVVFVWDRKPSA